MFYLQGMRHFGVGKANTFTNLIPIVTSVLSFFLLHENFPLYKILGIIIVIVGIFLVQKKKAAIIWQPHNKYNGYPAGAARCHNWCFGNDFLFLMS